MGESLVDKRTNRLIKTIAVVDDIVNKWKDQVVRSCYNQVESSDLENVLNILAESGYEWQRNEVEEVRSQFLDGKKLSFDEWNIILESYECHYNKFLVPEESPMKEEQNNG